MQQGCADARSETLTVTRDLPTHGSTERTCWSFTGQLVSLLEADAARDGSTSAAPLSSMGVASGSVTSLYGEMSSVIDSC